MRTWACNGEDFVSQHVEGLPISPVGFGICMDTWHGRLHGCWLDVPSERPVVLRVFHQATKGGRTKGTVVGRSLRLTFTRWVRTFHLKMSFKTVWVRCVWSV